MLKSLTFAAAISGITLTAALAQTTSPSGQPNPPAPSAAPAAPMTAPSAPMTTGSTARPAVSVEAPGPWLGSQVWKQAVYDGQENRIGEVDNLVIAPDGKITDVLIGVGGFLGMGEKTVAIPFANLKAVKRNGNLWFTTSMTKEQLNNAPAYDLARYEVK